MKSLLKQIRLRRGLTLRQVEALTGVSKSALARIEKDLVYPSSLELEMLAKGLHIRVQDLLDTKFK